MIMMQSSRHHDECQEKTQNIHLKMLTATIKWMQNCPTKLLYKRCNQDRSHLQAISDATLRREDEDVHSLKGALFLRVSGSPDTNKDRISHLIDCYCRKQRHVTRSTPVPSYMPSAMRRITACCWCRCTMKSSMGLAQQLLRVSLGRPVAGPPTSYWASMLCSCLQAPQQLYQRYPLTRDCGPMYRISANFWVSGFCPLFLADGHPRYAFGRTH